MQHNNDNCRSVAAGFAAVTLQLFFLFSASQPAVAHTPHHAIDAMQVSPDYIHDSTVYVLVQNNLLRSQDRGATWKQLINGLDSPHLFSSIALSPNFLQDNTMVVSTDGGGVYLSENRGDSFHAFSVGLPHPRIGMVQIASVGDDSVILAAGAFRGMYLSSATEPDWKRLISDDVQITALTTVATDDGGYALAGDRMGGVWKSNRKFADWHRIFKLEDDVSVTSLIVEPVPGIADTIYIGTDTRGLLRTTDNGASVDDLSLSWQGRGVDCNARKIEPPTPIKHVRDIVLSEDQSGAQQLHVSTWHGGVLASKDGGNSWSTVNSGLSCDQQADEQSFLVPQYRDLAIDSSSDWFLGGFNGLFRSADHGESWTTMNTLPVELIRGFDVSVSPSGRHQIALGTYGGGAYFSQDDGQTWSAANQGLVTTRISDVMFAPDGSLLILAKGRLLVSSEPGEAWIARETDYRGWRRRVGAGLERRVGFSPRFGTQLFMNDAERSNSWPMQIAVSPQYDVDQTVFVGLRSHGVWKSENAGIDWSRNWTEPVDYVTALEISPDFGDDKTVFAGIRGSGIFASHDAGATWRPANDGIEFAESVATGQPPNYVNDPPLQRAITDVVLTISPDFSDDQLLFAGTSAGLFKSLDGGVSWARVPVSSPSDDGPVLAIAVSPAFQDDGMVFVSMKGHGIFRSDNRGNSFVRLANNLLQDNHQLKFLKFSPDFAKNGVILGASDESVLMSLDAGDKWTALKRTVRYEDWRGAGVGPVQFTPDWSRDAGSAFSASTQSSSAVIGAAATLHFSGSQLSWLGERCPDCGIADVMIDGDMIASVDLFDAESAVMEVLNITDLESGPHRLQVRISGKKNALSTGHRVTIDAFDANTQ